MKTNKNLKSFQKAITVPFIICFIALIPNLGIKETFEWFELKCLDFLFTFYPAICELTLNESIKEPNSPTIIIEKDQPFINKYNRSPSRKDYANLLDGLKKQGVKSASLDFVFDEKTNEEDDNYFIQKLNEFPYPIIINNFIRSGSTQNLNLVNQRTGKESNIITPFFDINLDRQMLKGLINVQSGFDSVIRQAPLAYHFDDPSRFEPTLGFTTWLVSLLIEKEQNLKKIDISNCSNLEEAINRIKSYSPYNFTSTGHKGLDHCIKQVEFKFLYRFITNKYPNFKENGTPIYSLLRDFIEKSEKTWIKLPREPLPLIGEYNSPSIRLPYQKLAELMGDSIERISMANLLLEDKEIVSPELFDRLKLNIDSNILVQKIKPLIPNQSSGQNSIFGEIRRINGDPITNAKIYAIMPQTGYWQKGKLDNNGKFRIDNLPQGHHIIEVFVESENGCDKARFAVYLEQKEQELPLLMFANNTNSLEIPSDIIFQQSKELELWVYGSILPMINSNNEGKTFIKSIPSEDFLLSRMNNDEENEFYEDETITFDSEFKLLVNNEVCPNAIVAVTPIEEEEEKTWHLTFFRKISLEKNNNSIIKDLPPSIDAIINVTSKTSSFTKQKGSDLELLIKAGIDNKLKKLPLPYHEYNPNVELKISFIKQDSNNELGLSASDSKIILLSESGKEYEINNESSIKVPASKYLALTQTKNFRGLHSKDIIEKNSVFIGSSLNSDHDFVISPINFLDPGFTRIPGVNVHANLFAALSENRFLYAPFFHMDRAPNSWPLLQFLLVLPIIILLNFSLRKAKTTKSTLIILLTVLIICLISVILFPRRIIIPVFYPSLLIISFGISKSFIEWINFRRLANETQNAFSRFISADVVSQIVNNPDAIKPGGEKKELTIMFTDIAGFTSISEKLDAEALTDLMNNYLDEMTKILFKNGGTLDKYVGDAIMGFWNHPTPQEDHTTRAVTCAIEMQKKLKEMREKWMAQGLPKVEMRAGINSGICMVGFIGSTIQMNFTCLGDNVNLASRLEGANKAYGTFIMVSDAVKKQLNPYLFSTRFLDFLAVKGKNEPVLVYEIRGFLNEESKIWLEKAGKIYQQGIDKYLAREWDKAIELFNEVLSLVPDDAPSKVYIERCEHFKLNPPEEKWDGRFILKTK